MAIDHKEEGRPGSMGPDLDALDEDFLSADLKADLDGDFGADALGAARDDVDGARKVVVSVAHGRHRTRLGIPPERHHPSF